MNSRETLTKDPNTGHGHVFKRPDGVKARCGGPGMCAECSRDLAQAERQQREQQSPPVTSNERCPHNISLTANPPCPFCELERLRAIENAALRVSSSMREPARDSTIVHVDRSAMNALDCALEADDSPVETAPKPQAPIAKVRVREGLGGHYAPDDVSITLYAPGLPPGDHDLYCEPEAVAPYLRAETAEKPLKGGKPLHEITGDLVRDAARYRWLRDNAQHSVTHTFTDENGSERSICWGQVPRALDEEIDRKLARPAEETSRQLQPGNPPCCPFHWGAQCIGRCINTPGQKPWNERPENQYPARETIPVHPDPTGTTREPPHCPTCYCRAEASYNETRAPEKATVCTCEQDDCPHDAPGDQCCGKCRGAVKASTARAGISVRDPSSPKEIVLCAAMGSSGFICERPKGHPGRHCDGDNRRWPAENGSRES